MFHRFVKRKISTLLSGSNNIYLAETDGTTGELRLVLDRQVLLHLIEWFSVECPKTKTKLITLANYKEHTQYSEPIKTRSNYR